MGIIFYNFLKGIKTMVKLLDKFRDNKTFDNAVRIAQYNRKHMMASLGLEFGHHKLLKEALEMVK